MRWDGRSKNPNRLQVLERDRWRCQYCGDDATIAEHVIPWEVSRDHAMVNLVAACQPCNVAAGDRLFSCFATKRAYILGRRGLCPVLDVEHDGHVDRYRHLATFRPLDAPYRCPDCRRVVAGPVEAHEATPGHRREVARFYCEACEQRVSGPPERHERSTVHAVAVGHRRYLDRVIRDEVGKALQTWESRRRQADKMRKR